MSKVQSAISSLLTTASVGIGIAKGYQETKKKEALAIEKEQATKSAQAEKEAKIAEKEKLKTQVEQEKKQAVERKEYAEDIETAKRVALTRLGASPESQEAYLLAERMGTLNPRIRMRGEGGKLLFTAGTTARRMANMSLAGATYNRALTDESYRQRMRSMGKNVKERVKNILIAEKGGRV